MLWDFSSFAVLPFKHIFILNRNKFPLFTISILYYILSIIIIVIAIIIHYFIVLSFQYSMPLCITMYIPITHTSTTCNILYTHRYIDFIYIRSNAFFTFFFYYLVGLILYSQRCITIQIIYRRIRIRAFYYNTYTHFIFILCTQVRCSIEFQYVNTVSILFVVTMEMTHRVFILVYVSNILVLVQLV